MDSMENNMDYIHHNNMNNMMDNNVYSDACMVCICDNMDMGDSTF